MKNLVRARIQEPNVPSYDIDPKEVRGVVVRKDWEVSSSMAEEPAVAEVIDPRVAHHAT